MLATKNLSPTIADFEKMHDYVSGRAYAAAVYVAAKLDIADKLKEHNWHYQDLAKELNVNSSALYRLLRALSGEGVFVEAENGEFGLTTLGATMCTGEYSLKDLIIMCGEPWHWETWGGLLYTVKTGKPFFVEHFGDDFFPYIKSHPEVGMGFNAGMSSLSSLSNYMISNVVDFSRSKLLVDVGGGQGGLLVAILKRHLKLKAILYDLPKTIDSAKAIMEREGLQDRCTLMGGDFFTAMPKDADAYVIKHVFHGLNDEQCINILQQIKQAAAPNFRIFIVESIMPAANKPSYSKFNDLGMMLLSSTGRERTCQQFLTMLKRVGMELINTIPVCMGLLVIEAQVENSA